MSNPHGLEECLLTECLTLKTVRKEISSDQWSPAPPCVHLITSHEALTHVNDSDRPTLSPGGVLICLMSDFNCMCGVVVVFQRTCW